MNPAYLQIWNFLICSVDNVFPHLTIYKACGQGSSLRRGVRCLLALARYEDRYGVFGGNMECNPKRAYLGQLVILRLRI